MPANPQVTEQMVEKAALAMERGVCSTCGVPAVGDGGGYTDCGCAHPNWREATNKEKARAALEAALSDHVVVPREPTMAMALAGAGCLPDYEPSCDDARNCYRAMIAKRPLPQKEG